MSAGSITYVVVGSVEAARDVREDASRWFADGLVRPFLVLPAAALDSPSDPLGRWAGGSDHEVPSLAAVADQPYATVRVIAYQDVRAGSSGDDRIPDAALRLRDMLRTRLAPTQDLYLLNLLVPDDQVRGLPMDLLLLHATANVIVAPEDRASPERASYDLQEPWRHRNHGLMALLSLGGLWNHQEVGPLDASSESSMAEVPHIVLTRSFGPFETPTWSSAWP